jgi:hypothetical protein
VERTITYTKHWRFWAASIMKRTRDREAERQVLARIWRGRDALGRMDGRAYGGQLLSYIDLRIPGWPSDMAYKASRQAIPRRSRFRCARLLLQIGTATTPSAGGVEPNRAKWA